MRWLLFVLALVPAGCGSRTLVEIDDVPVHVDIVAIDARNLPVVILKEDDGQRTLPIWIGLTEARSIAAEIEKQSSPRPNTHDLAKQLIDGLEGVVERVVVTELRGGTYYAVLTLRVGRKRHEIDSRPSDAIAIALRAGAPIYVRAALFESVGDPTEPPELPEEPGQSVSAPLPPAPFGIPPATRDRSA